MKKQYAWQLIKHLEEGGELEIDKIRIDWNDLIEDLQNAGFSTNFSGCKIIPNNCTDKSYSPKNNVIQSDSSSCSNFSNNSQLNDIKDTKCTDKLPLSINENSDKVDKSKQVDKSQKDQTYCDKNKTKQITLKRYIIRTLTKEITQTQWTNREWESFRGFGYVLLKTETKVIELEE